MIKPSLLIISYFKYKSYVFLINFIAKFISFLIPDSKKVEILYLCRFLYSLHSVPCPLYLLWKPAFSSYRLLLPLYRVPSDLSVLPHPQPSLPSRRFSVSFVSSPKSSTIRLSLLIVCPAVNSILSFHCTGTGEIDALQLRLIISC